MDTIVGQVKAVRHLQRVAAVWFSRRVRGALPNVMGTPETARSVYDYMLIGSDG